MLRESEFALVRALLSQASVYLFLSVNSTINAGALCVFSPDAFAECFCLLLLIWELSSYLRLDLVRSFRGNPEHPPQRWPLPDAHVLRREYQAGFVFPSVGFPVDGDVLRAGLPGGCC